MGAVPGVNGNGTLATISFQTVNGGNTTLHLADTILGDSQAEPINHTTLDGIVTVLGVSDIAIINITPIKTIVGQGYSTNINVTVKNKGDATDTFNVTTYAENTTDSYAIEELQSTLNPTENTTGYAYGNYTTWAYAWPLPGETNTADNTFVDGWVMVTIPGDVDGDSDVDLYDAVKLLASYGAKKGDPHYHPNLDINCDGKIDLYDAAILLSHYGQKHPQHLQPFFDGGR